MAHAIDGDCNGPRERYRMTDFAPTHKAQTLNQRYDPTVKPYIFRFELHHVRKPHGALMRRALKKVECDGEIASSMALCAERPLVTQYLQERRQRSGSASLLGRRLLVRDRLQVVATPFAIHDRKHRLYLWSLFSVCLDCDSRKRH